MIHCSNLCGTALGLQQSSYFLSAKQNEPNKTRRAADALDVNLAALLNAVGECSKAWPALLRSTLESVIPVNVVSMCLPGISCTSRKYSCHENIFDVREIFDREDFEEGAAVLHLWLLQTKVLLLGAH
jgi:hypothetical protein